MRHPAPNGRYPVNQVHINLHKDTVYHFAEKKSKGEAGKYAKSEKAQLG